MEMSYDEVAPKKKKRKQNKDQIIVDEEADGAYFQTIKTSLKSVVKNPMVIEKLIDAANLTNQIMTHTLQFMKLYLIHCYDNDEALPMLDRPFVTAVMKVLCQSPATGRPPKLETLLLKQKLKEFHEVHYLPIMQNTLNYKHLNTVLDYMSNDIETMYENNVKQRYFTYVERFVNIQLEKKIIIENIKSGMASACEKKNAINSLCRELRKVKNDILNRNSPKTSSVQYHDWIDLQSTNIMPQRELKKNSIYYDIQVSPQDYLPIMIYMMKAVEATGNTISGVFPLRSNVIPKHFLLDTTSLIHLLFTKENGKKSDFLTHGILTLHQARIWSMFFKTEKKCFHKEDTHKYTFHNMIKTG